MAGTIVPWVIDGQPLGSDALEIGPGPGATTEALRGRVPRLTVIEIDPVAHRALTQRFADSTVSIVHGDGRALPFPDRAFDAVVCFTMLHHVPSRAAQDQLLSEAFRVLRPGGVFMGSDSLDGQGLRVFHALDTYVPVDPDTLAGRLTKVGFADAVVERRPRYRSVRFSSRRRAL
jgi:ubiquinone/menaquinone biosynthesis C-methylase UbiE